MKRDNNRGTKGGEQKEEGGTMLIFKVFHQFFLPGHVDLKLS